MRTPLLSAALAALTLAGCDQLLAVDAEVPAICQHLSGQTFSIPPAVRARYELFPDTLVGGVSLTKTFDFDVAVQVPAELKGLQSHVTLTHVTLTALDGGTFGFLDSANLTLEGPDGSSVTPTTFSYTRTAPDPTVVEWKGNSVDLAPYLSTGTLRYAVSLAGTLPPADLTVDLDACAAAAFSLKYFQQ